MSNLFSTVFVCGAGTMSDIGSATPGCVRNEISPHSKPYFAKTKISGPEKNRELKRHWVTNHQKDCAPSVTFCTHTSSRSASSLADKFSAPERLAGVYFFHTAQRMETGDVPRTKYSVSCIVREAPGGPGGLKSSRMQKEKVKNGTRGRKTGKGYDGYPEQ